MRRLADAAFRLLQTDRPAHRTREPGIGACRARPCAFVQAAEDQRVEALKARFQWTENKKTRMTLARSPHGLVFGERAEQGGVATRLDFGQRVCRFAQFIDETRGDFTRFAGP